MRPPEEEPEVPSNTVETSVNTPTAPVPGTAPIEEVVQEPLQETVPVSEPAGVNIPVDPNTNRPTLSIVSNEDAHIFDRMKSQPKTLEEVLAVKDRQYAPGEHRLSLPVELRTKEIAFKFSFRWVNKNKRAIDDALDVKGWTIVTRAFFSTLDPHLFNTSGAIERGDAILCFMSLARAQAMRKAPGLKSAQRMKSNPMISGKVPPLEEGESGLYKPENKSGETEGVPGTVASGYQEERDF